MPIEEPKKKDLHHSIFKVIPTDITMADNIDGDNQLR